MVKKRLLVRATHQGIERAEKAVVRLGLGTKTNFAKARRLSRTTITKFFNREPIQLDSLQRICEELTLPWSEIIELSENTELELSTQEQSSSSSQSSISDIDALVREVRQRVQPYIQELCGTMRVLDMTQPIALGDIYTSVNILEKIAGRRGIELSELMRDVSPEKFDRFCLGDVRERRVPGLEAVEKFSKLMILGKPGAGKTTFLKHLAIQFIGGTFQSDQVPVFVTLKDFAETDGKPDLLEYMSRLMPHNVEIPPNLLRKQGNEEELVPPFSRRARGDLQQILNAGRALILLDGLDEVRDADSSRVLRQIREFSQQFSQNQFVITCRIAAREYIFEKFTEVEIADFDDEQIADFSSKWFRCKNDQIKAKRFLQKLKEDAPIRELATSPLLLTLLCLVFEDSGSFPSNRAELYQTGVDVLLKKWDVKCNIERYQVYKLLSLKRKEDLLSQIARITFEAGNYFFKQREVERYIAQYIQNLPDSSTDPEVLELDSTAVLKSIEAQHGLFVERARGIYSFSHLTFHEYFTARKILTSCNPYAADDPTLQSLVSHLTEKRWREVILLTTGMLDSADFLLQVMKARIDGLLAEDEKLQQFLRWVDEKAKSVNPIYKQAYTIAIYFILAKDWSSNHQPYNYSALSQQHGHSLPFLLTFDFALNGISFEPYKNYNLAVTGIGITAFDLKYSIYYENEFNQESCLILQRNNADKDTGSCVELYSSLKAEFQSLFQNLFDQLPLFTEEIYEQDALDDKPVKHNIVRIDLMNQWWQENGQAWTEQLRALMIEHRNIGHDWQFSDAQKKLLQQYYDANELLVDCLNSDCYVSREVRQEIEQTLLLPIAEIQRRKKMKDET